MGYTHYWSFRKIPRGKTKEVNTLYAKAIKDCQRVVLAYQKVAPTAHRLSGYSAHTKLGQYMGINFNGKDDLSHESFVLRDFYKKNDTFECCKTDQAPYDDVVVACLAILKHYLGELFDVNSDGRGWEWTKGVALASEVLKKPIKNPIKTPGLGIVG